MKRLVLFPAISGARLQALQQAAPELVFQQAATIDEALLGMREADAFFGKLTPPLLDVARRLQWVQAPTASLEHYLFPALVAHPCVLTNMRGLFHDVIADHVMGYLLCFARNLHIYVRQQFHGIWSPVGGSPGPQAFALGPAETEPADVAHRDLRDATLGIVGLGSIGGEIARRALAFGMQVQAVDPRAEAPPDGVRLARMEGLDALLASSDYVVIAAPHTPQTAGLIHRDRLRQMRPSAYLINIGRGAIVPLQDLTAALQAGAIAGAALDVFEIEPLPPEHPLWRMPNVIITPHIAGRSVRVPQRHLQTLQENVRRFAHDEPLLNVVDKMAWC